MFTSRKPRGFSLIVITFALVLSTAQNISAANATTLTCAQGGVCVVGDTGPGGGVVFYVDSSGDGFNCGPTGDNMCMYLENGRGVGASGIALWSKESLQSSSVPYPGAAGVSVGAGYQNTLAIIDQQGPYDAVTNKYMAGAAQAFRGGGKTDWYLPSTDELYELHKSRLGTTSFTQSSTETSPTEISGIYFPNPASNIIPNIGKSEATNYFTSIRAFTLAVDGNYDCPGGSFDVFQGEVLSPTFCTGVVTIPDGVWSINSNAFLNSAITRISFPTTLRRIGGSAFQGATFLESIIIPDSVTDVGTNAFNGATAVTSVSIGAGLSELRGYSFFNLTSLVSLTIPSTVRTIGSNAFAGAINLQTLTISNGVTTISVNAFSSAHLLRNLIIPSSVTELREGSFGDTPALLSVRILSTSITGPSEDTVFYGTSLLACLTNQSNLTLAELGLPIVSSCSSAPDAPVISTLTGGDRQLRIAFTIASDGGESIDLIQYSLDSGATWVSASGTTSPINISSLSVATSYTLQIRAHNSVGNSSGSNLKTASTTGSTSADRDAAAADAAAREAARKAAIEKARINLLQEIQDNKPLVISSYLSADFEIPSGRALERINLAVQAMQAKTPDKQLSLDVIKAEVLKESVIDRLAKPETKKSVVSAQLIEVGLLENNYANKTSVMIAIRNSPSSELDSFEKVQTVISAAKVVIQARKARYAEIVSRIKARAAKITK
jgi:BspA type Leucine rich repeat region (6 copies)